MSGWAQVLYVPLPPPNGRVSILRALTRKTPLAPDVDLAAVGTHPAAGDYSGADLAALVREACVLALKVDNVIGVCLPAVVPVATSTPLAAWCCGSVVLELCCPSEGRAHNLGYSAVQCCGSRGLAISA
jgi:AAA+ lid domain